MYSSYFLCAKLPASSAFVFLLHCTGNRDANYQVKQYNYTEDFFFLANVKILSHPPPTTPTHCRTISSDPETVMNSEWPLHTILQSEYRKSHPFKLLSYFNSSRAIWEETICEALCLSFVWILLNNLNILKWLPMCDDSYCFLGRKSLKLLLTQMCIKPQLRTQNSLQYTSSQNTACRELIFFSFLYAYGFLSL